jgi:hypothetical protein
MNQVEELFELEGALFGQDTDQFLGDQVGQAA